MENNELNKKIIKNVRNKIVVSNLEKEEIMKINKKQQVISIVAVLMLFISGSFITVNAATDGKLAETVGEFITIKINGEKQEPVITETRKDISGDEFVTYKLDTKDDSTECELIVNKSELERTNSKLEADLLEDGTLSTVIDTIQ